MVRICAATLVTAFVGVIVATAAPPHASPERWVWGNRNVLPAVNLSPVVQSRHFRPPHTVRTNAPFFKSISARTVPSTPNANNFMRHLAEHDKQAAIRQKLTSIKPSPIDTTFVSHFDVYHQRKTTKSVTNDIKKIAEIKKIYKPQLPDTIPKLITTGEYPYPFGAKPIALGDGTSIGWAPEDTLLVEPEIISTKKPVEQFKPATITDKHDARYTTLDKLFDSREPTNFPDTHSLPNDVLGGLHPDEVFYADKDLVIIKGGGFTTKQSYHKNDIDIKLDTQKQIKAEQAGNELGDATNSRQINVRPDSLFANVRIPLRFVSGNIPTIVKPEFRPTRQTNIKHSVMQTKFTPVHQKSFVPMTSQQSVFSYSPSSSDIFNRYTNRPTEIDSHVENPTENYQSLDGDPMMAMSSGKHEVSVLAPVKRSTDSQFLQYHYQTRGNNARPIVDYKINKNGNTQSTSVSDRDKLKLGSQNTIPVSRKETFESEISSKQSSTNFSELEDLSAPANAPSLIPKFQVPKKRPSTLKLPTIKPSSVQTTQLLHTTITTERPHFKPSLQLPPNFKPSQPPQLRKQKPISLEGDTLVNYLQPRPPVNHQAEFLIREPVISHFNQNVRPSFINTRTIPTRVPLGQFIIQNESALHRAPPLEFRTHFRQHGRQSNHRFTEPRRRQPIRVRQAPRL